MKDDDRRKSGGRGAQRCERKALFALDFGRQRLIVWRSCVRRERKMRNAMRHPHLLGQQQKESQQQRKGAAAEHRYMSGSSGLASLKKLEFRLDNSHDIATELHLESMNQLTEAIGQ